MESFQVGIQTTIIGMGIVFSVLIVLSIFTWLLSKIVDGAVASREAKKKAAVEAAQAPAAAAPAPAAPAAPVAAAPAPQAAGISPKTVAAIMSAISAASGLPVGQLRFTAIRRGGGHHDAWSASSTGDIISTRQTYL